jgi:hypothetical protein
MRDGQRQMAAAAAVRGVVLLLGRSGLALRVQPPPRAACPRWLGGVRTPLRLCFRAGAHARCRGGPTTALHLAAGRARPPQKQQPVSAPPAAEIDAATLRRRSSLISPLHGRTTSPTGGIRAVASCPPHQRLADAPLCATAPSRRRLAPFNRDAAAQERSSARRSLTGARDCWPLAASFALVLAVEVQTKRETEPALARPCLAFRPLLPHERRTPHACVIAATPAAALRRWCWIRPPN